MAAICSFARVIFKSLLQPILQIWLTQKKLIVYSRTCFENSEGQCRFFSNEIKYENWIFIFRRHLVTSAGKKFYRLNESKKILTERKLSDWSRPKNPFKNISIFPFFKNDENQRFASSRLFLLINNFEASCQQIMWIKTDRKRFDR